MPARRANIRRADYRITAEAMAAYKEGRALNPASEEFNAAAWALHKALKLKPWQVPPLWIDPDDPAEWDIRQQPQMVALCERLDAAASSDSSRPTPLRAGRGQLT